MKTTSDTIRWLGLTLACGTLTFAVTTRAGKPVKPPAIEPGIVFYAQNGYVKMGTTDGRTVTSLFATVGFWESPRPSAEEHGGGYWFLTERSDGDDLALLAIAENGAQVRLSTGPDVVPVDYHPVSAIRWLAGDSMVGFIAIVPDLSTETNHVTGLYLMDIDWSSGIPVAAGAPQLIDWMVPIISAGPAFYGGCDFSPDGSIIYFSFNGELFKADVASGARVGPLATLFVNPQVHAGTDKLVGYSVPNDMQTVNTDGTGLTTIVPGSMNSYGLYAFWSPSGENIVYTQFTGKSRLPTYAQQITIISASGTVLGTVGDKAQFTTTLGWRPAR